MSMYPNAPTLKRNVQGALEWLFDAKPGVNVTKIDWQAERDLLAVDVITGEESALTTYPAGPWVCVDFADGMQYAVWKATGDVYLMDKWGAVLDDPVRRQPVLYDQEADNDELESAGRDTATADNGADREQRGGET